jgi:hypothetical protein
MVKFQTGIRGLLVLIAAAALLAQTGGPKEIPPHPPDGNPQHDHQPEWCIAKDTMGFKANCGKCDRACDTDNDNRCRVWCRAKRFCRCNPMCAPTGAAPRLNRLDPSYREAR